MRWRVDARVSGLSSPAAELAAARRCYACIAGCSKRQGDVKSLIQPNEGRTMPPEWLQRFAAHRHGTGILVFDAKAGVGVDWELVQTVAGGLFLLVRANDSTRFGTSDLAVFLALANKAQLNGVDSRGLAMRVETAGRVNPVHEDLEDDWVTFRATSAEGIAREAQQSAFRFAITNLSTDDPPATWFEIDGARITVSPVANYETVVSTLYTRDRLGKV